MKTVMPPRSRSTRLRPSDWVERLTSAPNIFSYHSAVCSGSGLRRWTWSYVKAVTRPSLGRWREPSAYTRPSGGANQLPGRLVGDAAAQQPAGQRAGRLVVAQQHLAVDHGRLHAFGGLL